MILLVFVCLFLIHIFNVLFVSAAFLFQTILCMCNKIRLRNSATRFHHGKFEDFSQIFILFIIVLHMNGCLSAHYFLWCRHIAEEIPNLIFTDTWCVPLKMTLRQLLV